MIVAPLMTPIMGTMLGVVLGDRANLLRSIGLVLAGAAAAITVGYLIGLLSVNEVVAATNPQVAGRVNPRLIDLLAALATGAVGSVALVRSDISDTLPGVAIAISLVPPLTVVGLTAESGAWSESSGALLLFTTNVAAILLTGTVVMAIYGVHRAALAEAAPGTERVNRRNAVLVVVALFVLVAIPLTGASIRIGTDTLRESRVRAAVNEWAESGDWDVVALSTQQGEVEVTVIGTPPAPDLDDLRARLEAEGVDPGEVDLNLVPREQIDLGDPQP
jgi:uncharacterized hydrophobic protein (TIGR00271 family)